MGLRGMSYFADHRPLTTDFCLLMQPSPIRVVFDLEGEEIVVLRVGHRREIYRR